MKLFLDGVRLVSEANRREHWAVKNKRAKSQKKAVESAFCLAYAYGDRVPELPVVVTITRIAPRMLDDDNLSGAAKWARDQIATCILPIHSQANQHGRRGDDSDDRLTFRYSQRRGKPKQYAVEITIEYIDNTRIDC